MHALQTEAAKWLTRCRDSPSTSQDGQIKKRPWLVKASRDSCNFRLMCTEVVEIKIYSFSLRQLQILTAEMYYNYLPNKTQNVINYVDLDFFCFVFFSQTGRKEKGDPLNSAIDKMTKKTRDLRRQVGTCFILQIIFEITLWNSVFSLSNYVDFYFDITLKVRVVDIWFNLFFINNIYILVPFWCVCVEGGVTLTLNNFLKLGSVALTAFYLFIFSCSF